MTHKTARNKLKQYYRILETAEEYQLHSSDIIIAVSSHQRSHTSPEEAATIRRIDLLARVEDTEIALKQLPEDFCRYIELRYGKENSVRQAGRMMYLSHSSADRMESQSLSAYISALGFLPIG